MSRGCRPVFKLPWKKVRVALAVYGDNELLYKNDSSSFTTHCEAVAAKIFILLTLPYSEAPVLLMAVSKPVDHELSVEDCWCRPRDSSLIGDSPDARLLKLLTGPPNKQQYCS
jgi:hypothetical protein